MNLKEYILNEAGLVDIFFGKIPFGGDNEGEESLRKLAGFSKKQNEPNTSKEDSLYRVLKLWVTNSTPTLANRLFAIKNVIEQAAKKYPKLFLPSTPQGTVLYRGLKNLSPAMTAILKKADNWEKITVDYSDYYICKTPVKYSPRSKVQSWTTNSRVVEDFADYAVLLTRQNKEYFFNQKVFEILFEGNESEILHFGKDYKSKIYIAVPEYVYESTFKTKSAKNWSDVAKSLSL